MTMSTRALISIGLIVVVAALASLVARRVSRLETTAAGTIDPSSPRRIAGGSYEASGLAAVPGDSQFLFVEDARDREIFLLTLSADGTQTTDAIALPLPADVTDMEGITTDGRFFYAVGSQSKKKGYDGDGLVRFTFDPRTQRIDSVERVAALKTWLARNVAELRGTEGLIGDEVLIIEGLAWDLGNRRLLLGLRAPVVGDSALVIALKAVDTTRPFAADNLTVDGTALRVSLGGAGIRGLEWDSRAGAFLLVSGASLDDENRDFRVFEWSGRSGSEPRQIATFDRRLKPEGIVAGVVGGKRSRVVVFDVGQIAVIRD